MRIPSNLIRFDPDRVLQANAHLSFWSYLSTPSPPVEGRGCLDKMAFWSNTTGSNTAISLVGPTPTLISCSFLTSELLLMLPMLLCTNKPTLFHEAAILFSTHYALYERCIHYSYLLYIKGAQQGVVVHHAFLRTSSKKKKELVGKIGKMKAGIQLPGTGTTGSVVLATGRRTAF